MRNAIRAAAVGAPLIAAGLLSPQAVAQDAPHLNHRIVGTSVLLSEKGAKDPQTRAIAQADPAAVSATASLCGSGYELEYAERLPDSRRYGTLFTYEKFGSVGGVCALFDNNTSGAKHMKLKLCPNKTGAKCKVDEGYFSQYAGPVKYESKNGNYVECSMVTALMWNSSGRAIIDRVTSATLCD
ncbi:hypothetical protein ACL02U_04440 [Streptomyces sp. MS06]|uniref:hypothetical protein n=1 Tax=Streptomyces sp. MS06 TaxID=3385974 RepID=UPI0039A3F18F